jgi:hypothetical protein
MDVAAAVVGVDYPRLLIRQILRHSLCLEDHAHDLLLQLIICVSFLINAYLKYFCCTPIEIAFNVTVSESTYHVVLFVRGGVGKLNNFRE